MTEWKSGHDVNYRQAAKHPGKQADEWLQMFLIELTHRLHLDCSNISHKWLLLQAYCSHPWGCPPETLTHLVWWQWVVLNQYFYLEKWGKINVGLLDFTNSQLSSPGTTISLFLLYHRIYPRSKSHCPTGLKHSPAYGADSAGWPSVLDWPSAADDWKGGQAYWRWAHTHTGTDIIPYLHPRCGRDRPTGVWYRSLSHRTISYISLALWFGLCNNGCFCFYSVPPMFSWQWGLFSHLHCEGWWNTSLLLSHAPGVAAGPAALWRWATQ